MRTHRIILAAKTMIFLWTQVYAEASDYESPYYSPASQENELYSQLRKQNIKAIPQKEIK